MNHNTTKISTINSHLDLTRNNLESMRLTYPDKLVDFKNCNRNMEKYTMFALNAYVKELNLATKKIKIK